jgi:hypothetical protein
MCVKKYSSYMIINTTKGTDVRSQDSLRGSCGGHSGNGTGLSSAKKRSANAKKKINAAPFEFVPKFGRRILRHLGDYTLVIKFLSNSLKFLEIVTAT